jgi:hypothetical protein
MREAAELLRNAAIALLALMGLCLVPELLRWYRTSWRQFLDRW